MAMIQLKDIHKSEVGLLQYKALATAPCVCVSVCLCDNVCRGSFETKHIAVQRCCSTGIHVVYEVL